MKDPILVTQNDTSEEDLINLWESYNSVRKRGNKKVGNILLQQLIDKILNSEIKIQRNFAFIVCDSILSQSCEVLSNNGEDVSSKDYRIQFPLFKSIITPFLIEGYQKNDPKIICWIGQFEQFFYSDQQLTNDFILMIGLESHFDAIHYFRRSFYLNQNTKALILLSESITSRLNFVFHEWPFGILDGGDHESTRNELNELNSFAELLGNKSICEFVQINLNRLTKYELRIPNAEIPDDDE